MMFFLVRGLCAQSAKPTLGLHGLSPIALELFQQGTLRVGLDDLTTAFPRLFSKLIENYLF